MLSETGARQRSRDERSARAVAAAVALAGEHGVRVEDPAVLADLFSVMVHLRPAPVVARVSTWTSKVRRPIAEWLGREIAVTGYLAGQGAPVVAPSGELPPGPHTRDGFAISFWTYLEADPDRTVSAADCAAMLVDLHAGLRSYPGELPLMGPLVNDVPYGLAALDRAGPELTGVDVTRLRADVERLRPFFTEPGGELQPLHGDVHQNNLVITRDGPIWIDFEDVCLGPVEWDLALLNWSDAGAVAAHHRPDPDRLARSCDLRALHLAMCLTAFRDDFGDLADWDTHIATFAGLISR